MTVIEHLAPSTGSKLKDCYFDHDWHEGLLSVIPGDAIIISHHVPPGGKGEIRIGTVMPKDGKIIPDRTELLYL